MSLNKITSILLFITVSSCVSTTFNSPEKIFELESFKETEQDRDRKISSLDHFEDLFKYQTYWIKKRLKYDDDYACTKEIGKIKVTLKDQTFSTNSLVKLKTCYQQDKSLAEDVSYKILKRDLKVNLMIECPNTNLKSGSYTLAHIMGDLEKCFVEKNLVFIQLELASHEIVTGYLLENGPHESTYDKVERFYVGNNKHEPCKFLKPNDCIISHSDYYKNHLYQGKPAERKNTFHFKFLADLTKLVKEYHQSK